MTENATLESRRQRYSHSLKLCFCCIGGQRRGEHLQDFTPSLRRRVVFLSKLFNHKCLSLEEVLSLITFLLCANLHLATNTNNFVCLIFHRYVVVVFLYY